MSQFPQTQANGSSAPSMTSYGATSMPPSHGYTYTANSSTTNSYPSSTGYSSGDYRYHPYGSYGQSSSTTAHTGDGTSQPSTGSTSAGLPPGFGYRPQTGPHQSNSTSGHRYSSAPHGHSAFFERRDSGSRGGGSRKGGRNEFGIIFGQAGAGLRRVDWSREDLPHFQKNFYREHASVNKMSDNDVKQWREENSICVIGKDIPKPICAFDQTGFPEYIMSEIRHANFQNPTPIQSQGWPMAMSGRDVIGIAKTGSGKTLAFILPSIVHINAQPLLRKGDGPIVLVVAPTRELAVQIEGETQKFAYSSKIKHTCVYGGVPRREQARALQQGVEICICTPGRLLDFLESGTTNLNRVTYLVIDEADRLLDMGFEPQLKAIFSQVRPDRQVLMWSATWPKEVRQLASEFMSSDTIQVSVGSWDTKANHDVCQVIEVMTPYDKNPRLQKVLRTLMTGDSKKSKILIFTATKRGCNEISRNLVREGYPVTGMHGDKEQLDRDRALEAFKSGKCPIMVATDVASRGIHVDDITHVINFDFPLNIEDYVHRIGRTGRVGKKGTAISFFTKDDSKRAGRLIEVLVEAQQPVPKELKDMEHSGGGYGGYGGGYGGPRRYSQSAYDLRESRNGGGSANGGYKGYDRDNRDDRDDRDRHKSRY